MIEVIRVDSAQREVFALCPNADRARELIRAIYKAHNRKAPDL